MLNGKVIGVGFGGTKGAIRALERNIVPMERTMIINSTLKDIPVGYEDIAAHYSRAYGGAAQERSSAKELSLDALQNDDAFIKRINSFIDPTTEKLVFVVATEGGTGSGSVPILAKYFNTVIRKINRKFKIEIFAITGFQDAARGMQNTIEFFQELDPSYTIQAISMKKYAEEGMTRSQAEDAADDEFAAKLAISLGRSINYEEARHVMDESDLLKLSTTPGYMKTWRVTFNKLKNADEFNKLLSNAMDNDKSLDIPKQSITRMGIITNIDPKYEEMLDFQFPIIKSKLGTYYDNPFIHDNKYDGNEQYIEFIAAGMKMPIDELTEVYEKYKAETQLINNDKDDFFSIMSEFRGDFSTDVFNSGANKKDLDDVGDVDIEADRSDFFSSFQINEPKNESSAPMFKDDVQKEVAITTPDKDVSKF